MSHVGRSGKNYAGGRDGVRLRPVCVPGGGVRPHRPLGVEPQKAMRPRNRRAGRRRGLFWAAVCSIPLTVALGVGLEFMIDRTNISRYLLYLVYILVLAAPVCLGLRLRREE